MMSKKDKIVWHDMPQHHDYPAAASYLHLLYDSNRVDSFIANLKESPISECKAKDIFRASGLSLLGVSNSHVKKDIRKIHKSIKLSPLLLVRDSENHKLIIADGYHRLCAVYKFDEDAVIPCQIC